MGRFELMTISRIFAVTALAVVLSLSAHAANKPCVTAEQAAKMPNKDVCISAHIYDVVELPDGTRYLDICSPDTPDERCIFTLVSYRQDLDEVGELLKYRNQDVHVRGIVRPMHGRAGIIISHSRQFYGGPEKFKPNPRLAHGFEGSNEKPPIHDPNLQPQGRPRSFMNTRDQEKR
jgi:hypothetical protein